MELSKKTTILLSPVLHRRLTRLAALRQTSIGELVRTACERQYGLAGDEDRLAAARALAEFRLPVRRCTHDEGRERPASRRSATLILIDANVLMYAVGAEHPHKQPCVRLLERIGAGEVEAVVDAETLQELLHRYRSLNRWSEAERLYGLTRRLFPQIVSITGETLDAAKLLMSRHPHLAARDAVHAAAVHLNDLTAICSYDRDFDVIGNLVRVEPDALAP